MLAKQNRFICPDCKLQYRLESDFEEHQRVGCRMQTSNRPTFSDKDVEKEELPPAVEQELIAEVVAEQPEPVAVPEKPKKKK